MYFSKRGPHEPVMNQACTVVWMDWKGDREPRLRFWLAQCGREACAPWADFRLGLPGRTGTSAPTGASLVS